MKRSLCTVFLTAVVLTAGSAVADEITIGAARDNTLYEDVNGLLSNGQGWYMFTGRTEALGGGKIRRAVIGFDIADSIPPGSTITSVELTLRMSKTIAAPANTTLQRLTSDWGEGESDAPGEEGGGTPAAEDDATWVHTFFDTDRWNQVGGDFVDAVSASRSVAGVGFYTWGSTAEMVADVQGWLDNPAGNFGWIVRGDEDFLGSAKRFDTRENVTEGNRPRLRIVYTPGPCSGREKLSASCKNKGIDKDLIKSKLKKGQEGATVTFRLDGDPNTDTVKTVRRGKAKAKFKKVADGDHTVEIVECGVSKNTSCP